MISNRKIINNVILGLSTSILLVGVFCSNSRGSMLSVLVSSAFLVIVFWKRIPKLFFMLMISILFLLFSIFLKEIIYYSRLEQVLSFRDIIWRNSFELVSQSPFLGLGGVGTFGPEYFARFGFSSMIDLENYLNEITITGSWRALSGFHAHNLFLNYAAELGIFGVFFAVMFYLILLKKFISIWKARNILAPFDLNIAIGCASIVLGNFIHSFFEAMTTFYDFSISVTLIFITSAIFASSRSSKI